MTTQPETASTYKFPPAIKAFSAWVRLVGRFSPATAARMTYKMWFRPGRSNLREGEAERLAQGRNEWMTVNRRRIALHIWGAGPPVLLVHGWASRSARLSSIAVAIAERGYQAVAFDAPANGESEGTGTSAVEIAGVIQALADKYGPFAAAVTHSFGGVAMAMALRNGLALPRLVAISPPADAQRLMSVYLDAMQVNADIAGRVIQLSKEEFGENIWDRLTMYHQPEDFQLPALIIHDRGDGVALFSEGEQVARSWPHARMIATDNLGHKRILLDRGVIAKVVEFIDAGRQG